MDDVWGSNIFPSMTNIDYKELFKLWEADPYLSLLKQQLQDNIKDQLLDPQVRQAPEIHQTEKIPKGYISLGDRYNMIPFSSSNIRQATINDPVYQDICREYKESRRLYRPSRGPLSNASYIKPETILWRSEKKIPRVRLPEALPRPKTEDDIAEEFDEETGDLIEVKTKHLQR